MKLGQWLGLICLIISFYILWQIRQILLLIFTAIIVAIALNSLARRVEQYGTPRKFALPAVIFAFLLLAILFFIGIVPPFIEQFSLLIELLISGFERLPEFVRQLETDLPFELPSLSMVTDWLAAQNATAFGIFRNFFSFFNDTLQILLQTLLVLILSIMLAVNPAAYRDAGLKLIPSFYRRRADDILCECEIALVNWMGGILISSVFVFALSFIGLSVLGIRLVLAHALLAGLLNFIPNIGPTLSVGSPILVALLSPDPWKAIAVFVLYIIIQNIESYWLTPTVMARQVSLLPALTLAAQIFFATAFGFLGLLLALPLAVVAKIWLQEFLIKDILDQWVESPLRSSVAVTVLPEAVVAAEGLDVQTVAEGNEGTSEEI
ncbi:AI-2E family transporter [Almyronema epifaneia]|uniref:AI-2E family transporter n=1 Tax=Almyronema epifaneia S1 TaxID=2991925 RepID=A0ABW6IFP7_9CYAN